MQHSHLSTLLGAYILESRLKKNILQKDLAKKLKMTGQFLGRIETGMVGCPRHALVKAINILALDSKKLARIHVDAATSEVFDLLSEARGDK